MPRGPIERTLNFVDNPTFGGVAKFADGTAAAPSITFANYPTSGLYTISGSVVLGVAGTGYAGVFADQVNLKSSTILSWSANAVQGLADLILARDAANTLALRNGTNAQAFRLYNTYTSEASHLGWQMDATTAGSFLLRYRNNGTLFTVGTFTSAGHLDVTRLSATQQISSGGLIYPTGASRASIASGSASNIGIADNNGTNTYDITLADWGTTTSAKSVSVAIDGTLFFGTAPVGTLFVTDVTGNTTGQFGIVGTRNATAEIYDSNGFFSVTKDTAASLNVYYDAAGASGAGYYLQNKRGAINAVRLTLIGG